MFAILWAACSLPAADGPANPANPAPPAKPAAAPAAMSPEAEIQELRTQIAVQQQQLDAMRAVLEKQQKLMEDNRAKAASSSDAAAAPAPAKGKEVAAAAAPAAAAVPEPTPAPAPALPPQNAAAAAAKTSPLQLQLGNVTIMPVGFIDAAAVWRNKNAGSGIGTNFGNIPFDNAVPGGHLNEFRMSPQNSRIGFRIDGNWKGFQFLNYMETDFLGTGAANNIGITNGAFVPRMRLFWVSVRKKGWEVLGGQSWSMFTVNRKGISGLPGDIFYGQEFDVNYLIGMPWTRQTGFRLLYHGAGDKTTFGISIENPNQYMGGYGGGGQIVLPAALGALAGAQLDNGSAGFLSTPNPMPDIIAKVALDPSSKFHLEVGGVARKFEIYNTTTGQPTSGRTFSKMGAGGEVNTNFEVVKGLRLLSNNQFGDGIGRYFFGNAPDVVVRADGSLSPIHTFTSTDGFEATIHNTLLYFYFGGIYIGKNVAVDANGTSLVGWGYTGSSNAQNRSVNEYTFGFNQTLWKSAAYGAINLMGQYEYATRTPWYVAAGALDHAADHTVYFDLRYTLPGGPPSSK
ncbi:MAG: hypothetical protein KGN36_07515 [Acidobacteriota bacterium]|nr:hypothetical protein [Acidobacteriota bacterium]